MGGCNNCICTSTCKAFIGAGFNNAIIDSNTASGIVSGRQNINCGNCSFIGAGRCNVVAGSVSNAFIGSGRGNCVRSNCSAIVGGCNNEIGESSTCSFIGSGQDNIVCGNNSAILGGTTNNVNSHNNAFIIGSNITTTAGCTAYVNNFYATGSNGASNVVILANLPTSDPGVAGQVWRSGNDLKISTG